MPTAFQNALRDLAEQDCGEHGQRATYLRGCRCEDCTRANREYVREWYYRRRGREVPR